MRTISVHVIEGDDRSFKALAALRRGPVAEPPREAMAAYLEREPAAGPALRDLPAHDSGRLLRSRSRSEVLDEMLER